MTQGKASNRRSWFGFFGKKKNHVDTTVEKKTTKATRVAGQQQQQHPREAQRAADESVEPGQSATASSSHSHASTQSLDAHAEKQALAQTPARQQESVEIVTPAAIVPPAVTTDDIISSSPDPLDTDEATPALKQCLDDDANLPSTQQEKINSQEPVESPMPKDQPVVTKIVWAHGGDQVFLTGTFDNWQKSIEMQKQDDNTFAHELSSPAGVPVQYKFVVDGVWKCDDNLPTQTDADGNMNNWISA
ncbi:immunoglobulin E-set [Gongronella butleri]|nr:immunoglobulin E-set [Gongronella butleri]